MDKFFFFIDGQKVESQERHLSGMAIKQLGHQLDANIDINHELVLEGSGHGTDRVVNDDEIIDLIIGRGHGDNYDHGQGQGPKQFSTRPRTNFGGL